MKERKVERKKTKNKDEKIIERAEYCGFRTLIPPGGSLSLSGHFYYCYHYLFKDRKLSEKYTCEHGKDFGWDIKKGNFPIHCPLKNIK